MFGIHIYLAFCFELDFCCLVEAMIAFPFQQPAGTRAAKNRDFFACLAFPLAPDTLGE